MFAIKAPSNSSPTGRRVVCCSAATARTTDAESIPGVDAVSGNRFALARVTCPERSTATFATSARSSATIDNASNKSAPGTF